MTALGNPPFNPVYSSWSHCLASYPRYRIVQTDCPYLYSRPYLGPASVQPVEGFQYIGPTKFPASINWKAPDDMTVKPVKGFNYIMGPTKFPEPGSSAPPSLQKYFAAFGSPVEPKISPC